ncbi:MAG: hypothetical protein NXH75_16225 [Halobacteriovoraceae bacterium]|nr:hypothetical protein [Halobacteriovoraceae bacterium]
MKNLILLTLLFFSFTTSAELYIEPYYMWDINSEFDEDNTPTGLERPGGDINNYVYGGRVYFNFNKEFLAGADYSISKSKFTINSTEDLVNSLNAAGTNLQDRFDGTHIGIIGGKKFGNAYTWVGAGVSTFIDDNGNSRTDIGTEYSGTYWLMGVGYHLFGTLKFNLEYRRHNLGSVKNPTTGVKTGLPDDGLGLGELDVKEIFFGISFPLIIGKQGK